MGVTKGSISGVLDARDVIEVSVGDYILSGGEQAALILMDAVIRLLPGVMGNKESADEESFETGLLEYPLYTRPAEWQDRKGARGSFLWSPWKDKAVAPGTGGKYYQGTTPGFMGKSTWINVTIPNWAIRSVEKLNGSLAPIEW